MHRCVQLLLQPTAKQQAALERLLHVQRELYNAALEERIGAWKWEGRSVGLFDQQRHLTGWDHSLLAFGAAPARGTLLRLDRAFQSFYRRAKAGDAPGFPRFQGPNRWDSVEYPYAKSWRVDGGHTGHLYLQGVGQLRFRGSRRRLKGTPKTLTVRKEGQRWRAFVIYEMAQPEPLAPTGREVGIDLGITALVTTSDGDLAENPRWTRKAAERLALAQRDLSKKRRGSKRRRRAVQRIAALHRRVRHQRRSELHRISRRLVDNYDLIVHEDLKILNMAKAPASRPVGDGTFEPNGAAAKAGLNKEILSAGWGILLRMITYKAEEAGRTVIAVDPRHTSQMCHTCGYVAAENRVGTVFRCLRCGHVDHADVNAACNILRAGLARRLAA